MTAKHSFFKRIAALAACLPLAFGLLLPACARAQDAPVRVGYYENEVFQEGAAEGAVKTGYAYEYYRKISEYTGWEYEYVYGDYGELYRMLLDGGIDLLAGLAWKEERAGLIGYPDAIMGSEAYYLVRRDEASDITADPSTLSGKTIGVLDSAMVGLLEKYLAQNSVSACVVTFSDYAQLMNAFDSGELDVFVAEGDGSHVREHARVLCAFGSSDYYLCVSVQRPDLLAQLNEAQALLAAEEPGYLSSLSARYYTASVVTRAFSASERDWIDAHSELRVGYLENYLPYSGTGAQGEATGLVTDVVPAMLSSLGISGVTASYRGYESYDDMIEAVRSGAVDAAFPVGGGLYYAEADGIYQSGPVASAATEIVFKGAYGEDTASHFAVNRNNRMQYYYVRTHFPNSEISFYPSIDDCLAAVLSGEVSCTTLNGLRANDILKNGKYRALSLHQANHGDDRCFGVKIGNEGLLRLLNRGVSAVGPDYAQNLSYRYAQQLYSYGFADMLRDNMALIGSAILAAAALVVFILVRDSRRTRREARAKEAARQELEDKNRELAESREALARALASAEFANRAKTAFLNNMSHDIRTPMNAIVGFTALAAAHLDNTEQVKDYLGKITVSSHHLLSLINDVLDMSRIESGKMTIEESEVHLPDLIHDLRTIIQVNVSAKQLDFCVDTQDVVSEDIVTDRLRLSQVLLNILSNAIKFTPGGGMISFRVIEKPSPSPGYACFEFRVKDNGIGMSKEFQKTIFEAFTREKTSTVSGIQGTGLGMAITKNIVDMMGGSIRVTSEEGKGSEFVVEIPCRVAGTAQRAEALPELNGLRALVADDDTDSCLSVCSMLKQIGMRPDWTSSGREAVVRAKQALEQADEFKAYIIDWMMPDLNGIETVRRIRRVIGDSAPIFILTAYDWSDIEDEAREAGVTAFCSKPLFMSELKNVLAQPFRTSPAAPSPAPEEEPADFTGKRVLLAEDNEMNQLIASEILRQVGFEIDIARDGEKAVEMMESAPAGTYDVILMDIQMPRMDGYEAARRIRALDDKAKSSVPIVAVTANAFEEDRKTALGAGMDGHLAKPYDISAIMETLKRLLG